MVNTLSNLKISQRGQICVFFFLIYYSITIYDNNNNWLCNSTIHITQEWYWANSASSHFTNISRHLQKTLWHENRIECGCALFRGFPQTQDPEIFDSISKSGRWRSLLKKMYDTSTNWRKGQEKCWFCENISFLRNWSTQCTYFQGTIRINV